MNLFHIIDGLKTEEDCVRFIEGIRWQDRIPKCPYCPSTRSSKGVRRYYTCLGCGNGFSVTVGTIFHNTNLPLKKWIVAIILFANSKQGLSAKALERHIGVNYRTAWRMLNKIRSLLTYEYTQEWVFRYLLQMDEVYLGPKPRKHARRKLLKAGNPEFKIKPIYATWKTFTKKKIPVAGIYDKGFRKVVLKRLIPAPGRKNPTGIEVLKLLRKVAPKGDAIIYTDKSNLYNILEYKSRFKRHWVNHSVEFVDEKKVHVNDLENIFKRLRTLLRIYVSVSDKYLDSYLNEMAFHVNFRVTGAAAMALLEWAVGVKHDDISITMGKGTGLI